MIKVYSLVRNTFFKHTFFSKMSGNTYNRAPIGVACLQRLCSFVCPRLRLNRLLCYQSSVLVLTYFTYLTYHLSRKPISVVKNVLHQNCSTLEPPPGLDPGDTEWCNWAPFNVESDANALLGLLDSAFLFSYAGAMFLSGFIAERVDLRYFLAFGMILSGIFSYGFGIAKTYNIHSLEYFLFMQAGAGIAQTTGWPGTVAVVGNWFGRSKKGLIFGIWNSHTSFGNILGALIASRYLNTDWALSMIYPGLVIAVMGFVVFLFLTPEPAAVGIHVEELAAVSNTPPHHIRRSDSDEESSPSHVIVGDQAASLRAARYSSNASPESYMTARHQPSPGDATETTSLLGGEEERQQSCDAISLSHALAVPGVVEFSLSLFFAKLVSYTFLYWLPRYIKASTTFSPTDAGKLSTLFDVGGIVGGIATGALADYSEAPAIVCVAFYIMSAPMLFLYQAYGSVNLTWNIVLLLAMGLLVNGPYALITTAVSAELGTHRSLANNSKALATITAIIDGTGSIGAAIGPMLAAIVSQHSWSDVFYMLISCNFLAMFFLMRIVRTELGRFRHLNRAAIRIE